ncbi:MAG: DUF2071 domain-containing protein [Planctomycetales bacterium]
MPLKLPTLRGVIDRRILANYRAAPDCLAALLPPPLRPQIVNGWGVAGICLIRLQQIRPWFAPSWLGLASENAAHRIAVEWEQNGSLRHGVYVHRRDTSSPLNQWAGGRLFPGVQHLAQFDVRETENQFNVDVTSRDREMSVSIAASLTETWPRDSIFSDFDSASSFFQCGSIGFSPSCDTGRLDAIELRTPGWHAEPLAVQHVRSSFFDNRDLFPEGSAEFDCALLMRNIPHEWHAQPGLQTQINALNTLKHSA